VAGVESGAERKRADQESHILLKGVVENAPVDHGRRVFLLQRRIDRLAEKPVIADSDHADEQRQCRKRARFESKGKPARDVGEAGRIRPDLINAGNGGHHAQNAARCTDRNGLLFACHHLSPSIPVSVAGT